MTKLTQNQLEEFIHLYNKYFGIELTEKEALGKALKLLSITRHTLFPNNDVGGEK